VAKNQRPITGEGSLQEWANDYQLRILHSIDLADILKLLADKGHAEICTRKHMRKYVNWCTLEQTGLNSWKKSRRYPSSSK
jgi:hypothetical protein